MEDVLTNQISIIQRSQLKVIRLITNAQRYITNKTLHDDLNIPQVQDVIRKRNKRHHQKLRVHSLVFVQPLLEPLRELRLKRKWPPDLIRD